VTNAAVRDTAQIRTLHFPVFAAGVNLRGAVKSHPGWTQIPISIGEVQVNPGDLVFADEGGGVIVRPERAREVAARAVERLSSLGR
jgi:4-hydroxy-4-methyl-2-oxoglutarate aldolase